MAFLFVAAVITENGASCSSDLESEAAPTTGSPAFCVEVPSNSSYLDGIVLSFKVQGLRMFTVHGLVALRVWRSLQ